MRAVIASIAAILASCAAVASLEEARLSSPSPEITSCAQWLTALDAEVAVAGVEDRQYSRVPDFPYLRADRFLAASRPLAAAHPVAFEAFADRLLAHDLEARRYEIDNLPAAVVEKWSGMRFEDPRKVALRRSAQCGRLLRGLELAAPQMRAALLERIALPRSSMASRACILSAQRPAGARVRFSPPPGGLSRAAVAGLLLGAELDALGQPLVPPAQLDALAATYAPSFESIVASDADRFGALRWRRGAAAPEVDATDPAVYVRADYARYGERGLLQLVYTVVFPARRIAWRVTLAPNGEPLAYDVSGADGCYGAILTPRARRRDGSLPVVGELPRLADGERPLVVLAASTHEIEALGVVRGADSLARYALRPYDELRSLPTLGGRNRAAVGRPVLDDADLVGSRLVFDLPEPRP